jgi:hypothetical protein
MSTEELDPSFNRLLEKIATDICRDLDRRKPGIHQHPSIRKAVLDGLQEFARAGTRDAEELRTFAILRALSATLHLQ